MKEMKFRAWDEDSKCFLKGDFSLGIESGEFRSKYGDIYENVIISQFTGQKDCNGKDIYEGDILENPEGIKGTVEFLNGSFCLNSNGYYVLNSGYLKNKKVIGNIYEKPLRTNT